MKNTRVYTHEERRVRRSKIHEWSADRYLRAEAVVVAMQRRASSVRKHHSFREL